MRQAIFAIATSEPTTLSSARTLGTSRLRKDVTCPIQMEQPANGSHPGEV
jgi:hypothetical protein